MFARFLFPLFLLVAITACSPVIEKRVSPVVLPDSFSLQGDTALPSHWWLSFKDKQLEKLINDALSGNVTLMAAWDRLAQAQAIAVKAGADLYPELGITGNVSAQAREENGRYRESENYLVGLVASYELDLWGRMEASRDAAEFDARASGYDLQTIAISLSAQVAATWYRYLEKYNQNELLSRQLATNRKALEIIKVQVRTGKVGIADMLQQQQLIETRLGDRALLEAQLGVLENQLKVLLGKSPGEELHLKKTQLIDLPPLPDPGLPVQLLQNRPDIQSSYMKILAADKRLAAAIADTYPRISLTARVETSGNSSSELFNSWLASLAANITAPLLDGGLRRAEVDRIRSLASERVNLYGDEVLTALSEVENGLLQERNQFLYLESLKKQLGLASQAIERIREKYIQGAVDYQRVLTALLSQQQIEKNLLTAHRELIINRIELCRALGGGWELRPPAKPKS